MNANSVAWRLSSAREKPPPICAPSSMAPGENLHRSCSASSESEV